MPAVIDKELKKIYVWHGDEFTAKVFISKHHTIRSVIEEFLTAYKQHVNKTPAQSAPFDQKLDLTPENTFLAPSKSSRRYPPGCCLFDLVEEGADVYIARIDDTPLAGTKKCANNGCGNTFTEETNSDKACRYHSMTPIFHETIKKWPCCDSKSDDFDEFLRIPGCTVGPHRAKANNINPSQTQQSSSDHPLHSSDIASQSASPIATEATSAMPSSRTAADSSKSAFKFQDELSTAKQRIEIIEEPDDPLYAVIEPGTKCLHSFCSAVFSGDSSRTEPCIYHPGLAIFYEGSKYWSCCKPRAGEFEEFLKIPGCKTGRHKFLKSDAQTDPNFVQCRRDYYQLGDQVCICVYGKNMDPNSSSVTYCTQSVKINIQFVNGKRYSAFIPLFSQIVPQACTHEWSSTKLEIKMKKCHPSPWTKLESEEPVSTT